MFSSFSYDCLSYVDLSLIGLFRSSTFLAGRFSSLLLSFKASLLILKISHFSDMEFPLFSLLMNSLITYHRTRVLFYFLIIFKFFMQFLLIIYISTHNSSEILFPTLPVLHGASNTLKVLDFAYWSIILLS